MIQVYDSAPLVQFPARHSGSFQLEDWVEPAQVTKMSIIDIMDVDTLPHKIRKLCGDNCFSCVSCVSGGIDTFDPLTVAALG